MRHRLGFVPGALTVYTAMGVAAWLLVHFVLRSGYGC